MTTRRPTAGTDATGTAGQTDPVPRRPLGLGASVIGLLADSVVPLLAYYALRAAGASVWVALVVPSVLTGAFAIAQWIRRRRIDVLGLFVLTVLVASVAISYVSGSPRFLLAKSAVFTAAIGAVLGSLCLRRPFGFSIARDLIERTTIPTADWDVVWSATHGFAAPGGWSPPRGALRRSSTRSCSWRWRTASRSTRCRPSRRCCASGRSSSSRSSRTDTSSIWTSGGRSTSTRGRCFGAGQV